MSSSNCLVESVASTSDVGKSYQSYYLAGLRYKNERLSKEIEILRKKSDEHSLQLYAELAQARSDLDAYKDANTALEDDARRYAVDAYQMRHDFQALKQANELLSCANKKFRGEIKEMKRHFAEYEQKFGSVMYEMSVLYGNLERAEALRLELQQENELLRGNSSATALGAPNNQRLKDASNQITALKAYLEEAVAALRDASHAQQDYTSKEELRRQVNELREREARHLDIIKSSVMIMEDLRMQNARRKEELGGKPPLPE